MIFCKRDSCFVVCGDDGRAFFKRCLGRLHGLPDAETHAGVFCDENFVKWCEDTLHFPPKPDSSMCRESEGEEGNI